MIEPVRVMAFLPSDDSRVFLRRNACKWGAEGKHITFVLATSGDKGSGDLNMTPGQLVPSARQKNGSRRLLGVKEVIFLRFCAGN
jgi:LmbE family N-acetylglucosaminyl deacetylase